MFVYKMGYDHMTYGKNCQDFGASNNKFNLICDGCSEGEHTEVGAKLFCHYMNIFTSHFTKSDLYFEDIFYGSSIINSVFAEVMKIAFMGNASRDVYRDLLCFTILFSAENKDDFVVYNCGDGYIITEDHNGIIEFHKLDDGEYPKYLVYNYMNPDWLECYKEGVKISERRFSKEKYKRVGVSSDGIRFMIGDKELEAEFIDALKSGKEVRIKRFINKHQKIFTDDFSIAF